MRHITWDARNPCIPPCYCVLDYLVITVFIGSSFWHQQSDINVNHEPLMQEMLTVVYSDSSLCPTDPCSKSIYV